MTIDRSNPRRAAVALVHGWEQPTRPNCRDCDGHPRVLGTDLCADCYERAMSPAAAPKGGSAKVRLQFEAKRLAWRVWFEGVVSLRELESNPEALDHAIERGWVAEVDDDARPGSTEPPGLPDDARAVMLVRWLRALGRPATYPEAQYALSCSRNKIGAAVKATGSSVAVKRGSSQTLAYVAPGDAPAVPIVARIAPEDRARQLAQLVQDRPVSRAEAARELGVSNRTVSLAAVVAVERGWITAGNGPGARYESRTP